MKAALVEIFNSHPRNYGKIIKRNSDLNGYLCANTSFLPESAPVKERLYCLLNELVSVPLCFCGNELKFQRPDTGYGKTCSYTCMGLAKRMTESEYDAKLIPLLIKRIEPLVDVTTPILHKCLECKHTWMKRPFTALGSTPQGCFRCGTKRLTKTHIQYESELPSHIIALQEYVNAKTKIKHQNTICGHVWEARPNDILTGFDCPVCNVGNRGSIISGGCYGIPTMYDGVLYGSKLEAACAEVIYRNFCNNDVERQKLYRSDRYFTCDFYIKSLDLYIEVSNFKHTEYLTKIEMKRSWVDNFIFVATPKQLEEELHVRSGKNRILYQE